MSADTGRIAVVSGASGGLGREIALELGRRGYALALLGRSQGALEKVLQAAGGSGLAMLCDVRDPAAVGRAATRVLAELGDPEVLVLAAGAAHVAALEETSEEDFVAVLETNLTGSFHLLRAFLPALRRRPRAWILPLLSVAARRGFPGWSAYCASKAGLAGLLSALREELRGSAVAVTALYPGATATGLWDALPGAWDRKAMIPPSEIARAVGYVLDADPAVAIEEIHLRPAGGDL
ncbi:MAG: SDR family oxidoreductase [Acidobacteriota bacterium]